MRKPKNKSLRERGSITERVNHLEQEVATLKRELAAERYEALKRDIAIGVEQADRGEVSPLDLDEIHTEALERVREYKKRNA
jgi:hypothetical protein